MANAYKIPYKRKPQMNIDSDENGKISLPKKRKLSNNLTEDEIIVPAQALASSTNKKMPLRKLRKNKQLIEKEMPFPISSEANQVTTKIAPNIMNDKNTDNQEGITELPEKNIQDSFTVQENTTKVEYPITEKIIEQKETSKVNLLPEIKQNNFNMKNEISTSLGEIVSQKDSTSLSQSKIDIDQANLNIKLSISACSNLNEPNLILNDNLKENILSSKDMNINELQATNLNKSVNLQIQDLKILKVVLEDPYNHCNKENNFIDKIKDEKLKLKNSPSKIPSKSSDVHLENNEQDAMNKYDSTIDLQEDKQLGFEDKIANEDIINESTVSDMLYQMNENYCSSDVENKKHTVNEVNSNTLNNSMVFDTTIGEETCSLITNYIKNNEEDKVIEQTDLRKNLANSEMESTLTDIRNISETKHNYNNQANKPTISKKIFGRKLNVHKKTLTISCMSALDYKRECEKNGESNSLTEKVSLETENSPPIFTNINLEALEENHLKNNKSQILKDSEIPKHEKSIVLSDKIIAELNSGGDKVKEEIDMKYKKSYNVNKMDEEMILQKTTNTPSVKDLEKLEAIILKKNCNVIKMEEGMGLEGNISMSPNNELTKLKPLDKTEIFNDEDLIAESITFCEKPETDVDIIPTGTFKHLNEIYECNKGTISVLLKELDPAKVCSSKERKESIEEEIEDACKLKRKTEQLEEDSNFLITAADYIKPRKSCEVSLQNCEKEFKGKNEIHTDKAIEKYEVKEDLKSIKEDPSQNAINEMSRNVTDEISISQSTPQDEADFLGIENCMEMDDDFALTASQLKMLDADEKMQCQPANKCTTSQQTDICGYTYFGNDAVTFEIINQLQYLRESVEYIRSKIEKPSSNDKNLM